MAARAALPVWRTTPVPILHYESEIPPARVLLQQIHKRASLRLRLLDEHHPLAIRVRPGTNAQGLGKKKRGRPFRDQEAQLKVTRVQRMAQLTEECERPMLIPPIYRDGPAKAPQGKEAGVKEFEEKLQADPPGTVQIYSDGSGIDSRTAWSFVVYQNKTRVYTSTGTLSKAEVFDAEIRGATEGLQWVEANMDKLRAPRIALCIDNTSVIQGIDGSTPTSSQMQFEKLKSLLTKLRPISVETRWTPGHMKITGNEEADLLAKAATKAPNAEQGRATVAWMRRKNREERTRELTAWWEKQQTPTYQHLGLRVGNRNPALALSRNVLHRLLAERSGHGDFAEYHERFKHEDAEITCKCGGRKMQWHFIDCRLTAGWKYPANLNRAGRIRTILGPKGWFLFQDLVQKTEVYRSGRNALQSSTPTSREEGEEMATV
ncbi:hypothetical protein MPH_13900 [Macrophomina phaseolina MS6]|uniref:RNase H type-1 domain-containing protein n=1 Tax=Macrophomina phaseolina (strain MS6) TaxID=1126212 RepID=K2R883_MACPH|nr:hypothetical protein MPH_13900 [Macrophomina phaseolina MS6]